MSRMYKQKQTFSTDALAAATAAASATGSLSRTESLTNDINPMPRHNSMLRTGNIISESIGSKRRMSRLPRRNSETEIILSGGSLVSHESWEHNYITDTELTFQKFDGGSEDTSDDNSISMEAQSRIVRKEIYVPGPHGIQVVQIPVEETRLVDRKRGTSRRRSVSGPLKRHGALRRSSSVQIEDNIPKGHLRFNSTGSYGPRDHSNVHINFQNTVANIDSDTLRNTRKGPGSRHIVTETIKNVDYKPKLNESSGLKKKHNNGNVNDEVMTLRNDIKKSQKEAHALQEQLISIRKAESSLRRAELHEKENMGDLSTVMEMNDSGEEEPLEVINEFLEDSYLIPVNYEDIEDDSIVSSIDPIIEQNNRKISTVYRPYKKDDPSETSNADLKLIDGKLNELLISGTEDNNQEYEDDIHCPPVFNFPAHNQHETVNESQIHSSSSFNIHDSQISLVPSLDLGAADDTKNDNSTQSENETRKNSMAKYLKASHPYLMTADEHSTPDISSTAGSPAELGFNDTSSYSVSSIYSRRKFPSSETSAESQLGRDSLLQKPMATWQDSSKRQNKDDSFISETSSIYSYHPAPKASKPKVINLNNISDTIDNCHDTTITTTERSLVVGKTRLRYDRGVRRHKISQSVDLDTRRGNDQDKLAVFNSAVRSKSLNRKLSLQTTANNINQIENKTFQKKHSRHSSFSNTLKKIFGFRDG